MQNRNAHAWCALLFVFENFGMCLQASTFRCAAAQTNTHKYIHTHTRTHFTGVEMELGLTVRNHLINLNATQSFYDYVRTTPCHYSLHESNCLCRCRPHCSWVGWMVRSKVTMRATISSSCHAVQTPPSRACASRFICMLLSSPSSSFKRRQVH